MMNQYTVWAKGLQIAEDLDLDERNVGKALNRNNRWFNVSKLLLSVFQLHRFLTKIRVFYQNQVPIKKLMTDQKITFGGFIYAT